MSPKASAAAKPVEQGRKVRLVVFRAEVNLPSLKGTTSRRSYNFCGNELVDPGQVADNWTAEMLGDRIRIRNIGNVRNRDAVYEVPFNMCAWVSYEEPSSK